MLLQQGAEVVFICRRQPGDLIALLEKEFRVLALPEQELALCDGLEGRKLYESWLGCSQAQDAHDCLKALSLAKTGKSDWLVVDHYGLDAKWQSEVKIGLGEDAYTKLLVIDDLANRPHLADLLLDQNFLGAASEQRYQGLVPTDCRQLIGPHYALLGPEYSQLQPLVPLRKQLSRVLIFFGGVDSDNLSGRALEALMDADLAHVAVDVVLGRQTLHRKKVTNLIAQRAKTTLHGPLPSLAGLIARADIAIGAGGATTWERACLKLPTLMITIAANQRPIAKALDQAGHCKLLGDATTVSVEQIRAELLSQITNSVESFHDAGSNLTDGNGASRLALSVLGPQSAIKLRRVEEKDEAVLLRWANDYQVRANSFSRNPISPSAHKQWFSKGLNDPNRLLLIATTEEDIPIGQIRFDRQLLHANSGGHEATIDLSIDRCARGYGLAVEMLRLGLQTMEEHWGPGIDAVAEVLASNAASNACFSRANFAKERALIGIPRDRGVIRWHKASPHGRPQ